MSEHGFIDNILLPPEEELEYDLFIKECPGSCDICKIDCPGDPAKILHRLYEKYLRQKDFIKQVNGETWQKIKQRSK